MKKGDCALIAVLAAAALLPLGLLKEPSGAVCARLKVDGEVVCEITSGTYRWQAGEDYLEFCFEDGRAPGARLQLPGSDLRAERRSLWRGPRDSLPAQSRGGGTRRPGRGRRGGVAWPPVWRAWACSRRWRWRFPAWSGFCPRLPPCRGSSWGLATSRWSSPCIATGPGTRCWFPWRAFCFLPFYFPRCLARSIRSRRALRPGGDGASLPLPRF